MKCIKHLFKTSPFIRRTQIFGLKSRLEKEGALFHWEHELLFFIKIHNRIFRIEVNGLEVEYYLKEKGYPEEITCYESISKLEKYLTNQF